MTKFNNNKTNCNCKTGLDNGACKHAEAKKIEINCSYGYYSKVLNRPFDSIEELKEAEAAYYDELKAQEAKVAQKKADAQKVEDAFKALNTARKEYKEKITQLTTEYSEALTNLKKAFELGKKDMRDTLAAAEDTYATALKEFTAKHKNYHMTLKGDDFETTISGSYETSESKEASKTGDLLDTFNWLFGF